MKALCILCSNQMCISIRAGQWNRKFWAISYPVQGIQRHNEAKLSHLQSTIGKSSKKLNIAFFFCCNCTSNTSRNKDVHFASVVKGQHCAIHPKAFLFLALKEFVVVDLTKKKKKKKGTFMFANRNTKTCSEMCTLDHSYTAIPFRPLGPHFLLFHNCAHVT